MAVVPTAGFGYGDCVGDGDGEGNGKGKPTGDVDADGTGAGESDCKGDGKVFAGLELPGAGEAVTLGRGVAVCTGASVGPGEPDTPGAGVVALRVPAGPTYCPPLQAHKNAATANATRYFRIDSSPNAGRLGPQGERADWTFDRQERVPRPSVAG